MIDLIRDYYEKRGLVWPNTYEALAWAHTELGEVYEILLSEGDWVRNNPDSHPQEFDNQELAEELGDVIMMTMVAGIVNGVNPLKALKDKMERKLNGA